MIRTISALVALSAASAASAAPFPSYTDPATGRVIYKLTNASCPNNVCQEDYGLYYHTRNSDGDFLVYRHRNLTDNDVSYHRLNLVNGTHAQLTPYGTCNGEFVSGSTFYCLGQQGAIKKIVKVDLFTLAQSDTACAADPGYALGGSLTVNATGTYLIFAEFSATDVQIKLCRIANGATSSIQTSPDAHKDLNHFQFSPANPNAFTYFRPNNTTQNPTDMAVGTILNDAAIGHQLYFGTNPSDPFTLHALVHPFYAADGSLWTDFVQAWSNPQFKFVNLAFSTSGLVTGYQTAEFDRAYWPNHTNAGRDGTWFVGDGVGDQTHLAPSGSFVQQIKLAVDDGGTLRWRTYPLASAVGTNYSGGNEEANAHYVPSRQWVVWSAHRTLDGAAVPEMNVFATEATVITSRRYPVQSAYGTDWDIKDGEAGYWAWSGNTKTWVSSGGQGLTEIVATPAQANVPLASGQLWGVAWNNAVQWNGTTWLARGNPTHLVIDCENRVWGIDIWNNAVRWDGASWQVLGGGLSSIYLDGCTLRGTAWGVPMRWTGSTWVNM